MLGSPWRIHCRWPVYVRKASQLERKWSVSRSHNSRQHTLTHTCYCRSSIADIWISNISIETFSHFLTILLLCCKLTRSNLLPANLWFDGSFQSELNSTVHWSKINVDSGFAEHAATENLGNPRLKNLTAAWCFRINNGAMDQNVIMVDDEWMIVDDGWGLMADYVWGMISDDWWWWGWGVMMVVDDKWLCMMRMVDDEGWWWMMTKNDGQWWAMMDDDGCGWMMMDDDV